MKTKFLKQKKIIISTSAILLVVAISLPLLLTPKDKSNVVREREYPAKKGSITVGVESSGQINTLPNIHSFEENTVVDEIFVKVGSEVKKGDKLATISADNLSELIKMAKDELSDAKATLLQASSTKDVMLSQNHKNKQDGVNGIKQEFDGRLEQLASEKNRIQKSIKDYESEITKLEKQNFELTPQVKYIEIRIADLKDKINKNIIKIGDLNEKLLKVDTGSAKRKELNEEIANIQYEIQKLNTQLSQKLSLANSNHTIIQQLEVEIKKKHQDISELKRVLDETEEETKKAELSKEIERLNDEIKKKIAEIEDLSYSKEIVNLQKQISRKENQIRKAQSNLNNLSDGSEEMNAIRLEITKLQNKNTALQQEIDKLSENPIVEELEKLRNKKSSTEDALEKEYTAFSSKLEEIQKTEKQYEQALENQGKNSAFADYKVNEELKAINENISKANRNVVYVQEKLNKLFDLDKNPTLYAQMDGIVTALNYKTGDVVVDGRPLCVIGELSEITMTVPVSSVDIGSISIGQKVNVFVDAFAEQKFSGTVVERLLVANDNGDYPVTIAIDPEEQMLLPGMRAFATIILKEKQDILTISNKAILLENGEQYVNVKKESGELVKTKVATGFSDGRISEVLDGLSEDDIAVVQE
ncbi:HlyD family efflux transporter periplasmic adaptor subunit [Natronincola ferrireducens]|uniref:HlyD family secretion protein n=1 Tax=Natronincola ferrireducens TaxID=393762 RepID=A0A1G8ZJH0_9FIRM|nr:HlyD family efflux transporter periplasmic adaptor subunit [Natronincola ferrireducens]SDK15191.1 HlyD family secretion protein [Natronincola ferrireducens]